MIPNHRLLRTLSRSPRREVWQAEGPHGMVAAHLARGGISLVATAEMLQKVSHPYVIELVDYDRAGAWMTTRWVDGVHADRWADGASTAQVLTLLGQVADGLAAIHAAGLVHGDLSTANVLVTADRTPRILDLDPHVNEDNAFTPSFAAPERLRGVAASERTDLYGLGAFAWRLLTGALPFGEDAAAAVVGPLRMLPPSPSMLRPTLPGGVEDLVMALMAANPRARPRPAARLRSLLEKATSTQPRPPSVGQERARAALRSALVEVLAGRSVVLVVYGPTGSGRRTLIRECMRAARREGLGALPLVKAEDIERIPGGLPGVVTVYDHASWCPAAIEACVKIQGGVLLLVHADRPVPIAARNGGRTVPVPPLERHEAQLLIESLGGDPIRVDDLMERGAGRPGPIVAALQSSTSLSGASVESRVLAALAGGPKDLREVATTLGLTAHRLMDHLEPLLDRNQVVDVDGRRIALGG